KKFTHCMLRNGYTFEGVEGKVSGNNVQVWTEFADVRKLSPVCPQLDEQLLAEIVCQRIGMDISLEKMVHTKLVSPIKLAECVLIALTDPVQQIRCLHMLFATSISFYNWCI